MDLSGIDCLGLDRVLKRGSGKIIAEMDGALLLRDEVSGAYMLACGDTAEGMALLDRHISDDCRLLMVADRALGLAAYEKFGFSDRLECYQVAYYGKTPSAGAELQFRTADESDLPMLTENYALLSPEELRAVVPATAWPWNSFCFAASQPVRPTRKSIRPPSVPPKVWNGTILKT